MMFLTVLLVYLFVQLVGSGARLHHDGWFQRWSAWLQARPFLQGKPGAILAAAVTGPAAVVLLVYLVLTSVWSWLGLVVAVPVVLYSLGRGQYRRVVEDYLSACDQSDWEAALASYQELAQELEQALFPERDPIAAEDWSQLHGGMLTVVCYRGFERLFAVLFWFILLGPAGALVYRLSHLFLSTQPADAETAVTQRWLWIMEWPAARVLGLSLALTGNFVGCFQAWRLCLFCPSRTTAQVLTHYVQGALGVTEGDTLSDVLTHRELRLTLSLYYRTWIFWMCLLAIGTLMF